MENFASFLDKLKPRKREEPSTFTDFLDKVAPKKSAPTGFSAYLNEIAPPDYGTRAWAGRELIKAVPTERDDKPFREIQHPVSWHEALVRGGAPMTGGAVPVGPEAMAGHQRTQEVLGRAAFGPATLGLSDLLYGEAGIPETAAERTAAGVAHFGGFLMTPVKLGSLVAKGGVKALTKIMGEKVAPTVLGNAINYGVSRGMGLGLAGVLSDIKEWQNAPNTFATYAIMGEIFGVAGLAHIAKHPVMSQVIRQVGGRWLLEKAGIGGLTPESFTAENIGETVFQELLNTFFLSHGVPPSTVFAGGLAHNRAVRFIKEIPEADRPNPEVVKKAGGPARWLGQQFRELADATSQVREMARTEGPETLYAQEQKKAEQLAIPGVEPAPEKPVPFKPAEQYRPDIARGEGPAQRVLPMPDAAPLFAGTGAKPKEKPKPPDTLFAPEVPSHAGQGGWSPEALSRAKGVKFFVYDTRTGQARPLVGVDAVDVQPRLGEIKYQVNQRTGKAEVVDAGPMGDLALARRQLQDRLRAEGVKTDVLFAREYEDPALRAAREEYDWSTRMQDKKEQAAQQRYAEQRGEVTARRPRRREEVSERDHYEQMAADEGLNAIREGLATWDSLAPAYRKVMEKRLTEAELAEVRPAAPPEPPQKPLGFGPERPVAGRTAPAPPPTAVETARIVPTAAKEPWQMTRAEFQKEFVGHGTDSKSLEGIRKRGLKTGEADEIFTIDPESMGSRSTASPMGFGDRTAIFRRADIESGYETMLPLKTGSRPVADVPSGKAPHKYIVQQAVSEGKPVPPGVLKDYPDLAKATQTVAEKAPGQPLGRAPRNLPELETEIVRINEGRVSQEQAAALGALVKGVARYKGMTPDEYIAARFAELEVGKKPTQEEMYSRAERAELIKEAQRQGITEPKMLDALLRGEPIAAVQFLADGKAVLRAFRKSSIAGMAHELGHVFRRDLAPNEMAIIERALGVKNGKWDRYSEERWAKQFELYLKRGKAPNAELNNVFAKFKSWLGEIYKYTKEHFYPSRVNKQLSQVMDKLIGGKEIPPPAPRRVGREAELRPPRVEWPPERAVQERPMPKIEWEPGEIPIPKGRGVSHVGATVGGDTPTATNPVVKVLNPERPGSAGLTQGVAEKLKAMKVPKEWGWLKRAIRNPVYMFEKLPVLLEHVRRPDVTADHQRTLAVEADIKRVKGWYDTLAEGVRGPFKRPAKIRASEYRIWVYATAQQKGGKEALEVMGIKEIPQLNQAEMRVYKELIADYLQSHGRANEARKLLGLDPIGKVENYIPFLRKAEELEKMGHDLIYDPDAAAVTHHLNQPVEPGFFKRRGTSDRPLQTNLFSAYKFYKARVEKYIQKAPVWANSRLLLEDMKIPGPDGKPQKYNWSRENPGWAELVKNYVEFSVGRMAPSEPEYIFGKVGRKAAAAVNRNLAVSILGYNVRSAFIQWSAARNTYIGLGRKWMIEGVKRTAFEAGGFKRAINTSEVLLGRFFDVHQAMLAEQATPGAKFSHIRQVVGKIGMAPLQGLDLVTAVWAWHGAHAKATAPRGRGGLGLSGKKAVQYADDFVTMTQASGAARDIAPIQRTQVGKLATVFQTFVINEWNYLAENVALPEKGKFTPQERYWNMYRFVVGTAVVNFLMEDVMKMRSPFPAPEYDILRGLREGDRFGKIAVGVLKEAAEQLPGVGGSIRWTSGRRVALPAVGQMVHDLFKMMSKAGIAVTEHDLSKMSPTDLAVLGQLFGVPGTSQFMKTVRRREQGGTWPQAVLGQKMEELGEAPRKLTEAEKKLLKKYGLGGGRGTKAPKYDQREMEKRLKRWRQK